MQYPHCDQRILHAPGECRYCDELPDWQELRQSWCMAFSGHPPEHGQTACPADLAVLYGERGDYNRWDGNRPSPELSCRHGHDDNSGSRRRDHCPRPRGEVLPGSAHARPGLLLPDRLGGRTRLDWRGHLRAVGPARLDGRPGSHPGSCGAYAEIACSVFSRLLPYCGRRAFPLVCAKLPAVAYACR